jgi:4'-phosphopantetheinyl transferase
MLEITWTTARQAELPPTDAWLGPRERALLSRLRAGPRRDSFRLGRYAAKRLLGELEVLPDSDGAPCAYRGASALPVTLSLSHRDGVAVCAAVTGAAALGCDIERVEPRSPAFVRDFLTPRERAAVAAASDGAACANLIWSAKESALKALHVGLTRDTWELEVSLSGCAPWAGARVRLERVAAQGPRDVWCDLCVTDLPHGRAYPGGFLRCGQYVITLVCGL